MPVFVLGRRHLDPFDFVVVRRVAREVVHVAHPHLVLDVSCTSHDHVALADVHRRDLALFHRLGDGPARRASHTDSLGVTSGLATSTATPLDQAVKQPAASATTVFAVPALPAARAA
eukprot:scaffold17065_cov63-Phaeocystis_antarctica.AAC.1